MVYTLSDRVFSGHEICTTGLRIGSDTPDLNCCLRETASPDPVAPLPAAKLQQEIAHLVDTQRHFFAALDRMKRHYTGLVE